MYTLDEMCRRHCVDLIPTLVIQSIHQRLPLDVLKNFSHSMISIVFVFDQHSISAELAADAAAAAGVAGSAEEANGHQAAAVHIAAVHAACITACELVIKDAHLAGCTTLSLASSEWTRVTADPMVRNFVICFVWSCTFIHHVLIFFTIYLLLCRAWQSMPA